MAETIGRADIIILADGQFFEASVRRVVKDADVDRIGAEMGKAFGKSFSTSNEKETEKGHRRWLTRLRDRLNQAGAGFDRLGNKIGRIFGRGSRNDLVNAFGGFMSLVPRLLGSLSKVGAGLSGVANKIREVATAGDFATIFKGIGGGVGALVGAAVMIKLITSSLGLLGAALSLTTGLVLALAGSLAFALVGGITAVAGALVPFAAGLGVAALALGGLQKMAKTAPFKALKKDWEGLQKSVAKEIFGKQGEGLKVLSGLLKAVKPLIIDIAGAIGDLVKQFGKFTQSKGFIDAMSRLRDILPGMVTKLGNIGGNLLLGLGNAFLVAEPMITRFLDWLEKITSAFAKSNSGDFRQSPMLRFFAEAEESALIVWDLIEQVIGIIGDLFSAGKSTGDSVLQKLADSARELNKWLSDPANQDTLQQWFEDAGKLATKLGEVATQAIRFIDALDTPESRAQLLLILDWVGKIIQALTWLVTTTNQWTVAFFRMLGSVVAFISGTWGAFISWNEQMPARLEAAWSGVTGFFAGIWTSIATTAIAIWNGIIAGVSAAWQRLVLRATEAKQGILTVWGSVVGFFQGIGRAITAGWGGATGTLRRRALEAKNGIVTAFGQIKGKIAGVPGQIAGVFSGLAGKVITKAGNLASAFARWVSSLAGKARSTATGVISAFSNLAGRMITRAGSILGRFTSWVAGLPGKARSIAQQIANAFSGLASKAIAKAGSITAAIGRWASGVYGRARGVANDIVRAFSGLAGRIIDAIGTIVPKIRMPNIKVPTVVAKVITPKKAAGGIVNGPQIAMIGEAGPEAIVPLNRALSRVDPAVRELSAIAQGLAPRSNNTSTSTMGRTIDVGGITINTPTEDPRAVASEVINRFTAAAYI